MRAGPTVPIFLDAPTLRQARAGHVHFLKRVAEALEAQGWTAELRPLAEAARHPAGAPALIHRARPTHPGMLVFRRVCHPPFWTIDPAAERWRHAVAGATFDPDAVEAEAARAFVTRLRARVLPGPPPRSGPHVLVPLQGRLTECRSFQTMAPVEMLARVCTLGRPVMATRHPGLTSGPEEEAALALLVARHPNLTITDSSPEALRDCAFVATMNSTVGFDGLILNKPLVLFGQIDFHHIALNVAQMGVQAALEAAPHHRPATARYVHWFLKQQAIDAAAADAPDRILAAMRKGGWSI